MSKESEKDRLKKEFKRLFKSMDFVCDNYLNKEGVPEKVKGSSLLIALVSSR